MVNNITDITKIKNSKNGKTLNTDMNFLKEKITQFSFYLWVCILGITKD